LAGSMIYHIKGGGYTCTMYVMGVN